MGVDYNDNLTRFEFPSDCTIYIYIYIYINHPLTIWKKVINCQENKKENIFPESTTRVTRKKRQQVFVGVVN